MDALRYVEMVDDAFIEGWLVPFGGSFDGKDSYGTYATRNTDFCLDWFAPNARPLLYQHGRDPAVGPVPIGRMCGLEVREHGVWMQAQLDKRNAYFDEIKQLVCDGQLGLSSGAMAHLVDIDEGTGEWKRWPIVEGTTTPAESNLLATIDLHTFKSHVRAAGIDLPADALARLEEGSTRPSAPGIRRSACAQTAEAAPLASAEDQTPNADARTPGVATRADDGAADPPVPAGDDRSYEDLISDLRDLLNPSNPFSQAGYTSIMATYPDHVLCCRWDGYGDPGGEEQTYWRVAYSVGDDGEPTLGAATQVEQTYVPVASSRSAIGPLTLDAHQLTLHAGALAQRTQDLSDRRIREGRVLSAHNRQLLTDAHARMGEAHGALGDLLDATGRQADEAARAAQWGDPAFRRQQFALLDLFASTVK